MNEDLTTLICLFHHKDQAQAALEDILEAGIPESNVTLLGGAGSNVTATQSSLAELNVPQKDQQHLLDGIQSGGVVLSVAAISGHADKVESIFKAHKAGKIDETTIDDDMSGAAVLPLAASAASVPAAASTAGEIAIPIAEEELVVGKRTVDAGGVRVYRRIVEIPVEESVSLREEHVNVERRPVDRPVTDADLAIQGDRVIELTETAEEAVVGKSARVVEEVLVGKEVTEHTERIQDTVRHTEVEVEQIEPDLTSTTARTRETF